VRLRLYHHHDGARVAYREVGTGPPLGLLHSGGLSHREWEPVAEHLADRYRLVLPDLPLHGDSEDRPHHPYTPDWLADVIAGFCAEALGPQPLVGGHGAGAELLLRAVASGRLRPRRLVIMPTRLHGPPEHAAMLRAGRMVLRAAAIPGLDRAISQGARLARRPAVGQLLTGSRDGSARDLARHAWADVAGNGNRARSWARLARSWPLEAGDEALDLLDRCAEAGLTCLLLWADGDPRHPVALAEEALRRLPDAQLRVLPGTGFLIAYDDPVGVARELAAFCG
jgi:pimeloyl-ACP methyl ester carboxylesterase